MWWPILITRTIPKVNVIIVILLKEFSEFSGDSSRIDLVWMWWFNDLKILLAACKEFVMMTICLMLEIPTAWLILHLMVKSLGSVVVILTAWWIVLITGLSCEWICNIEIATLFLILVSDITMEEWGLEDTLIVMLSRLQR